MVYHPIVDNSTRRLGGLRIGLDDDTQDIHWYPQQEFPCPTDQEIAEIICDYAGATHENIRTDWRNVDVKPSWA